MPEPKDIFLAAVEAAANQFIASSTPQVPPPITNPSGIAIPRGDILRDGKLIWSEVFADDFTRDVAPGRFGIDNGDAWWPYPLGWTDTSKQGNYDPKVLSIDNSQLIYDIRTENGKHLVASACPVLPGAGRRSDGCPLGFKYMRISLRFRAEPMYGYKIAWLTWPNPAPDGKTYWPRDGEIDFPELNLDGGSTIGGFMHRQDATASNDQDYRGSDAKPGDWHTCTIDWAPNYCAFILDGKILTDRVTGKGPITERVPNTPMRISLQAETNLDGRQAVRDDVKGKIFIDWITVHKLAA